ncbi:YhcN/YlaJ family sporulation lipoprotein [Cohnella pontilimi]|uniref:YhcN/YlaJ family sporulation lipoprotein n=1 Tax=Cohnella pontilimi TaxID=2564100 RepID=A0A4U0FEU6_9BACL|nr:YhcN/YlaJ family sporulation lipoprotein [Cohnella pontilimi]TJY43395.1 YhcN/YlaJ family sporulation lipoprotein [Cohnella pontilimi]
MKSKTAFCAAVLLIASAVTLSGCGNNARPGQTAQNARVNVQNTVRGVDGTDNGKAAHLAQLARGVRGVNDANCVVFGRFAIVGIDVDPKMDRSRVGTIKYAVAEAFRKDPYGANAMVTADIDLAQRIREISADVQRGRPVAGFAEELADIVGRIMPNVGNPNTPVGQK